MASLPPPTAVPEPHLWYVSAALLVVLGCLTLLLAGVVADSPFGQVPPRPAAQVLAPVHPDDAATLLNNTPLAIAPADAVALNAARSLDALKVTAAEPFVLPATLAAPTGAGRSALDCLTQAIYYEAASESDGGQRAVAQVVLNRMRSPLFPHSVCGVVYQGSYRATGCQFSFTCDGSLARVPSAAGWARARRAALTALAGGVERTVGLATHYHANYVVPYWASSLDKVSTIGAHIFYTMRGSLGRPTAFRAAYDASIEVAPTLELTPAEIDGLAGASSGDEVAAPAPPLNRTTVAEDARGTLAAPATVAGARTGLLRADDRAGELLVDRPAGVLDGR